MNENGNDMITEFRMRSLGPDGRRGKNLPNIFVSTVGHKVEG